MCKLWCLQLVDLYLLHLFDIWTRFIITIIIDGGGGGGGGGDDDDGDGDDDDGDDDDGDDDGGGGGGDNVNKYVYNVVVVGGVGGDIFQVSNERFILTGWNFAITPAQMSSAPLACLL